MGIDLGALGKGAAADEAVAAYEASGVDAAVVAVGGSVGVYGGEKGRLLMEYRGTRSQGGR